jgi:beta-xylosidase
MKLNSYLLIIGVSILIGCSTPATRFQSQNPLPVEFGDPFILKASDGKYYMTGTGGVRDGFKMLSSNDLVNWQDEGRIFQGNTETSWCVANFWAPELYEHNGKFYLVLQRRLERESQQ